MRRFLCESIFSTRKWTNLLNSNTQHLQLKFLPALCILLFYLCVGYSVPNKEGWWAHIILIKCFEFTFTPSFPHLCTILPPSMMIIHVMTLRILRCKDIPLYFCLQFVLLCLFNSNEMRRCFMEKFSCPISKRGKPFVIVCSTDYRCAAASSTTSAA